MENRQIAKYQKITIPIENMMHHKAKAMGKANITPLKGR
jgi:hypothetical protein